ncbi:MAG: hypothetical protein Q8Q88_03560 [Phenylobacterium sp.]|nr:hypothetical protein [Phenylobacterium sp.]
MPPRDGRSICSEPSHLYDVQGRRQIGALLEGWLARNLATPFELIHRPDLVRKLVAAGAELQHAMQKVAVPAALARKTSVHEIIRSLQRVVDEAVATLLRDDKQGRLPEIERGTFAQVCIDLLKTPDGRYLLGAGVARGLAQAESWNAKVQVVLDLLAEAPTDPAARELALSVLEQPISEILGSDVGLASVVGQELDRGGLALALIRLAHGQVVEAVTRLHPSLASEASPPSEVAAGVMRCLDQGMFPELRIDLGKRVLRELQAPGRLRPDSVAAEIELTRVLAVMLTASAGGSLPDDEVRDAIVERSRRLVEPGFINTLLEGVASPLAEGAALLLVLENVAGDANRLRAFRLVEANVTSARFSTETLDPANGPETMILDLARFYRRIARAGAGVAGAEQLLTYIGELAGRIDQRHGVIKGLTNALMPRPKKLELFQRMASGETAPPGPVAEQASAATRRLGVQGGPRVD